MPIDQERHAKVLAAMGGDWANPLNNTPQSATVQLPEQVVTDDQPPGANVQLPEQVMTDGHVQLPEQVIGKTSQGELAQFAQDQAATFGASAKSGNNGLPNYFPTVDSQLSPRVAKQLGELAKSQDAAEQGKNTPLAMKSAKTSGANGTNGGDGGASSGLRVYGDQRTSLLTKDGIRPKSLAELRASVLGAPDHMGSLVAGANDVHANNLANQAAFLQDQADQSKHRQIADQNADIQFKNDLAAQQAKISNASQQVKDFQIHDGGFLKRNPGSVLQAVGAVFGGILSARTGQPNVALQSLENSIDRDVQAQKDRYEQKRGTVNDLTNQYAHFRQLGLDDSQARMMAEARARQDVADQFDAMQKNGASKEAAAQSPILAQQFRDRGNQLAYEAALAGMQKPGASGAGSKPPKGEEYVPGLGGFISSTEAPKYKEHFAALDTIDQTATKIRDYYQNTNGFTRLMDPKQRIQIAQQGKILAQALKKKAEVGSALSPQELEFLAIKPEDSTAIFDFLSTQPTLFQSVLDSSAQDRQNLIRNSGAIQGSQAVVPGADGSGAVKTQLTGVTPNPTKTVAQVGARRQ